MSANSQPPCFERLATLQREVDDAIAVAGPSMPESGILDAVKQLRQVVILEESLRRDSEEALSRITTGLELFLTSARAACDDASRNIHGEERPAEIDFEDIRALLVAAGLIDAKTNAVVVYQKKGQAL